MSAVFHESDEAVERGLFERRARVQRGAGGVPSLDAVLGAARDDSRESSSGRRRAWTGLALAAACLVTVVKTRPHDVSPPGITADVGASSGNGDAMGGTCEEQPVSTSTRDSRSSSMAAIAPVSEEGNRACVAPPATFESSRTLSCDRDEANRTEMP